MPAQGLQELEVLVEGQAAVAAGTGAMGARVLNFTSIPVIDIGSLFGDDRAERETAAREIGEACRDVGFFHILNHGIHILRARKPPSQLRLLHYPENDLPVSRRNLGIGAHSDFECFTILHQQAPGLQVMNAANERVEAPPIEGTFIVNIGDLMEGWTNGLFKATQHRAVNTGKERYSMPLFFAADYQTLVEPLPQFVTPEKPAGYGSILAGEHLAGFSINDCKHLRKRVLPGDLKISFPIHSENPFKRRAVNEYQVSPPAAA